MSPEPPVPLTAVRDEPPCPKIVVIDANGSIEPCLSALHPRNQWLGQCADAAEFLASGLEPDIVVLDLALRRDGQPWVVRAHAVEAMVGAGCRVLLHTLERRPLLVAAAIEAGASGLVDKADGPQAFDRALAVVANGGQQVIEPGSALEDILRGGVPVLTDRQWQVLIARTNGQAWRELARRLFITEAVAREHLAAATAKLSGHVLDRSPGSLAWALGVHPGDTFAEMLADRRQIGELARRRPAGLCADVISC